MRKILLIFEHLPIPLLITYFSFFFYEINQTTIFYIVFFGWLLDLDHLFDYFYYLMKFKIKFSISTFLSGKYFKHLKKIFIILHSYEITLILITIATFYDFQYYFIALAHIFHLLQDQLTNNVQIYSYFFSYRLKNRFNISAVCY